MTTLLPHLRRIAVHLSLWMLLAPPLHAQQDDSAPDLRLIGDIGAGVNAAPTAASAQSNGVKPIPYLNFDYGSVFARIDTFGVKLTPVGAGSVELLTRVLSDGYTPRNAAAGTAHRADSLPLGVGTLQVTPVGALMANFYHDLGKSKGNLIDLMYAAELPLGALTLYPQVGIEHRSAAYVRYYNGDDSANSLYRAGASNNTFAAVFVEMHLSGPWYANINVRRTWLGKTIQNSPRVQRTTLDTSLVSLSYRFN